MPGELAGGFGETETTQLGKLVHYGCLFKLESEQLAELDTLRVENTELREALVRVETERLRAQNKRIRAFLSRRKKRVRFE